MISSDYKIERHFFKSNDITFLFNSECEFVDAYTEKPELLFFKDQSLFWGNKISAVISGDLGKKLQVFCENILETKKSSSIEYKLNTPGGYKWFFAFAKLVTFNEKEFLIVECNDVDEIKFKETKSREHFNDQLATIAGSLVHEIINPLSIVDYHLKSLAKENYEDQKIDKALKQSILSVDRITTLVKEIRLLNSVPEIKLQEISLEEEISAVISELGPKYTEEGVHLSFKSNLSESTILGDSRSFRTCFFNIVDNARNSVEKASKKEIEVHLEEFKQKENTYFQIRISDTGMGIRLDDRDKIFDTLYKGYSNKKNQGLGLTVSKYLLKLMNADLRFENSTIEGSTFVIDFLRVQH